MRAAVPALCSTATFSTIRTRAASNQSDAVRQCLAKIRYGSRRRAEPVTSYPRRHPIAIPAMHDSDHVRKATFHAREVEGTSTQDPGGQTGARLAIDGAPGAVVVPNKDPAKAVSSSPTIGLRA